MVVVSAQRAFAADDQTEREHWRSIVLFGRNVASYKFALAKSLLELGAGQRDLVRLEELAVPFARNVCEHVAEVDTQSTSPQSRFLDACRFFNAGRIGQSELHDVTTLLGFNNVIDAFHVVGAGEVPTRFFVDERSTSGGVRLTDELIGLASGATGSDLTGEAEARWRLVEEAWDAKRSGQRVTVLYDISTELLVPALLGKRRSITEVRPALNGYQKGHCFYCFRPISLTLVGDAASIDVDHFFPHSLMARGLPVDLDAPWNLVLACSVCNRGPNGKFASLPARKYLQRLYNRNEFLIGSHHPLRETLIESTGSTSAERRRFLHAMIDSAEPLAVSHNWSVSPVGAPLF